MAHHVVFGRVVEGLDVMEAVEKIGPKSGDLRTTTFKGSTVSSYRTHATPTHETLERA
jgi:cyclophilin family peptidyl-prolyl cis-trans isomerase